MSKNHPGDSWPTSNGDWGGPPKDCKAPTKPTSGHVAPDPAPREDQIEAAYWRFDSLRAGRGRGPWLEGSPMAERDAFKTAVREALAEPEPDASPLAAARRKVAEAERAMLAAYRGFRVEFGDAEHTELCEAQLALDAADVELAALEGK